MKYNQITCPHTDLHVGVCYGEMVVECTECKAFVSLDDVKDKGNAAVREAIKTDVAERTKRRAGGKILMASCLIAVAGLTRR